MKTNNLITLSVLSTTMWAAAGATDDATKLVRDSFDYYRGSASISTMEMTIHRPDWERTQIMKVWTVGEEDTLLTTLEPSKDRGNGTLKIEEDMWIYNPKVKRTIKIPPSMMAQAWMGSDFSNNDLAKSNNIIDYYTHRLLETIERDGHTVSVIESTPKPGAPVVWGKQILKIRDDLIFLEQIFFDESEEPVKSLTFSELKRFDGKLYPARMRMSPEDKPGQYTEIYYRELTFPEQLPDRIFTLSSLKNPPRR